MNKLNKQDKQNIKRLLCEWGNSSREIHTQTAEIAKFKQACLDIELAQGSTCNVVSINSLKKQAKNLSNSVNMRLKQKYELDEIINSLPFDMQMILRTRYIKHINWDCMPMHLPHYISERQCYRLHEQALEAIFESYMQMQDVSHDIC